MKRLFCVFLLSSCVAQSAELMPLSNSYFAWLPVEVLNHIAGFLDFDDRETEKEFIDRTSALKDIKPEHASKALDETDASHISCNGGGLLSYSVDGRTILRFRDEHLLAKSYPNNDACLVKAFNIDTAESHDVIGFGDFFNFSPHIICFAISRHENKCAQLIKTYKWNKNSSNDSSIAGEMQEEYYLTCKELDLDRVHSFNMPDTYKGFVSIGFNKQGTQVIVYARKNSNLVDTQKDDSGCFYQIFPLVFDAEHAEKSTKTLALYFAQLCNKKAL